VEVEAVEYHHARLVTADAAMTLDFEHIPIQHAVKST